MVLLAAAYFSRKIGKPISQFARSATEIARGNFNQSVEVMSDDEIGKLARIFNYMTTELRRLHEMNLNHIINEKTKTETIIKNIADGIIVTDPENRIVVLNPVAERWFHIRERDVAGRTLESCTNQPELIALINQLRSQDGRGGTTADLIVRRPSGPGGPGTSKELHLQAKAARVLREDGGFIGIVTVLRDLTREREIDRMKTELVSMVAHELRSPLTSISGFAELLLEANDQPEQRKEYTAIIHKESNRLGEMINKFLDISRIESGRSQLSLVMANLGDIVQKVAVASMYQADRKDINIELDFPDDVPEVAVDEDMIGQVVGNLLSNAIKYSPEHTTIRISATVREKDILVEVADQGYGISENALPHVFEKFYRVTDNEHVRDTQGSGLGLALVKEIVELHGGEVSAKSILGVGSVFSFTLPKVSGESIPQDVPKTSPEVAHS